MTSKLANKFLNACWQKAASYKFATEETAEARRVLNALREDNNPTTQHDVIKEMLREAQND